MVRISTVCLLGLLSAGTVVAQSVTISRVRTLSSTIRVLIDRASRLSPTFQTLIKTIESTDGIVYLDEGRCKDSVRACLLHSVTLAGPNRLLRVKIDTRRSDDEIIAAIGHELQHVVEVLGNPQIRSNAAAVSFFQQQGISEGGTAAETAAALQIETEIDAEIKRAR